MVWNFARRCLLERVLTEATDDSMVFAKGLIQFGLPWHVAGGQSSATEITRAQWASHEIVVAPPVRMVRNRAGELHCEDGLALEYRDGWQVYLLHHAIAPESFVMRPEAMTDDDIRAIQNSEQVRQLGARLGWERIVRARGVSLIDEWIDPQTRLCYGLYAGAGFRGVCFLKKQSPLTKQGTQPEYFEPVPSGLRTAAAARKWQALAAFVDNDTEAWKLIEHCNKDPALVYDWEA